MARSSRANSEVDETPINKSETFKGHPQPPVNERLQQAKIFLADEDPNRYLGFLEKLGEVEEYIKYIGDENLDHDASLLRDVRVMAQVQRDWDRRAQKGPGDSVCCDAPSIMPSSLRLISADSARKIQEEREAMGIEAQMRDDHPPFTTSREGDQIDFLKAMQEDARKAPEDVDEERNLLWVESRAYARALKEPGLIPYWMHDTRGLAKGGLKQGEKIPWYRVIDEKPRPPPQALPGYLERRRQEINRLLKVGSARTDGDQKKLEELLQVHMPDHLKALYARYESTKAERDEKSQRLGRVLFGGVTEKEMEKVEDEFKTAQRKFKRAFRVWCRAFKGGVQLMILKCRRIPTGYPGVFYFPPKEIIPPGIYDEVQKAQDTLNKVKVSGFRNLDVEEKKLLIKCLGSVVDELAFLDYCDGLRQPKYHGHVPSQDPSHVNNLADLKFADSMEEFALKYNAIKVLNPGEMDEKTDGVCSLEYLQPSEDISSTKGMSGGGVVVETATEIAAEAGAISGSTVPKDGGISTTTPSSSMDFTGKSQRRGIQRAAIELALNLLATNQEQHRPEDRFRKLDLPSIYELPPKEVSLSLSLEPSKRPIEMDTFKFTKEIMEFQHLKDSSYELARTHLINEHPESLHPPANLNGPFTLASTEDKQGVIKERMVMLTDLCSRLVEAHKLAPRPLLQRMLLRIQEAISRGSDQDHHLWDDDELRAADIGLLSDISAPSWDDDRGSYDSLNLDLTPPQRIELREFDQDVDEIRHTLPFWRPREQARHTSEEQELSELDLSQGSLHDHEQRSYKGMRFYQFKQKLNQNRLNRGDNEIHLWDDDGITRYLGIMRQANRIHFDSDRGRSQISRIPLSGHPENRFVLSVDSAEQSNGVRQNEQGNLEVQYDADGTMGPPIVQPNKFHHLQKIVFRVGRDISRLLNQLAQEHGDSSVYFEEQLEGLNATLNLMGKIGIDDGSSTGGDPEPAASDVRDISLQHLAVELHRIAPHLAQMAGINMTRDPNAITDGDAAALLQMEILEEASNNWESRFPEGEHVWEFAAPRVENSARKTNTQFFNMRRFPVCCQSIKSQTALMASGPSFERTPEPRSPSPLPPQKPRGVGRPVEIYRGEKQRPYFPFGETPYQQAYLDFIMQRQLRDVPEFQPKTKKRGLFDRILGQETSQLGYALPKFPENWKLVGNSLPKPSRSAVSGSQTSSENDILGNSGSGGQYMMSGALQVSDSRTDPTGNPRLQSAQKRLRSGLVDEEGRPKRAKKRAERLRMA